MKVEVDEQALEHVVGSFQQLDDPSPTVIDVNPQPEPRALHGMIVLLILAGLIVAVAFGDHKLKQWHERLTTPYAHFAENYVSAEAIRG